MMRISVFIFLISALVIGAEEEHKPEDNKVCVDVYYESLCRDSIQFVTKQLYPALQTDLAKFINLTLVPYGKSNTTKEGDNYKFSCHHGEGECRGNRIHACAIKTINEGKNTPDYGFNKITTGFVNCLLGTVKNEKEKTVFPTEECAKNNKVEDVEKIEKCASAEEANGFLNDFGTLTAAIQSPLKSVPTIVFNKKFKTEDSQLAEKDFVKVVCQYIKGDKPALCTAEKV